MAFEEFDDILKRAQAYGAAVQNAHRIVPHLLLAALEPKVVDFIVRSPRVGAVTRILRSSGHDEVRALKTPCSRHDLLWSSLRYLEHIDDHEELIVGFGRRIAQNEQAGIKIDGVWKGVGTRNHVSLTPLAIDIIKRHLTTIRRGAIVVIHNHPRNDIKSAFAELFDWRPVPSSGDRESAIRLNLAAQDSGDGVLRWYLVDEGEMAEFHLPPLERLADFGKARP